MNQGIGTFDLGDDERLFPKAIRSGAQIFNVGGRFDKRLAHCIHSLGKCEFQAVAIVIGEGADAEIDTRQVEALAGSQFATDEDFYSHSVYMASNLRNALSWDTLTPNYRALLT